LVAALLLADAIVWFLAAQLLALPTLAATSRMGRFANLTKYR